MPDCAIKVKLPTAYMVWPHWTNWRTCSVVPVAASCGVPLAGVFDTEANAGCALPVMASAAPVITARALAIKLGAPFKTGPQQTITTQS